MSTKSKKDRPWVEAFTSNVEAALDTLSDNELTRSIPVVGTAFKLVKGLDEYRTASLVKKLELFINSPGMRTENAAREWAEKVQSSPEETKKVGETLFFAVDKVIDTKKPEIFAKIFLTYLSGRITASYLLRIVAAVDFAFIEDLEHLRDKPNPSNEVLQHLLSSGLVTLKHTALYGGFDSFDIKLNQYGVRLGEILRDAG